jgi:hypothetical protein
MIAKNVMSIKDILINIRDYVIASMNKIIPEPIRTGRFRLSGESHLYMYDEYLMLNFFGSLALKIYHRSTPRKVAYLIGN